MGPKTPNPLTPQVRQHLPRLRHARCARRYSVVSAVYDVAPFLDRFLRSLVRQSVDFDRHIEVILVDDGSRDRSAEIIARWQSAHPRSIHYIRKENGGQASARNLGLEHATGDWITFIDPDDFVDERYFQRVDALLSRPEAREVVLVACKLLYHREGKVADGHALRSQFDAGDAIVPVGPHSSHVQLSAASAFFRRDLLSSPRRRFDEELRPVFEDGQFTGQYLMDNPGGTIGICARAKYFYSRRDDGSSAVDTSWTHPGRFGTVIERGYLDLLRASARSSPDGRAARWVQRTVLYELCWHFVVVVAHAERLSFLTPQEIERYSALIHECFAHIEETTIVEFDLPGCSYDRRVAMLAAFKSGRVSAPQVFIDRFHDGNGSFRLRSFHPDAEGRAIVRLDGVRVAPTADKLRTHDFVGEPFINERIAWIPCWDRRATLTVEIDGIDAEIHLPRGGTALRTSVREVAAALSREPRLDAAPWYDRMEYRLATSPIVRRRYADCLIFMDRDSQADDNAEHLYRYVLRNHPDTRAYFVLRRESRDWDRLCREGFRLIPFGSIEHRVALINARHLISSHADHYVLGYPTLRHRRTLHRSRFTFLQHGVIKDDLSHWLNAKTIDCFVTASPAERRSIIDEGSPYRFSAQEVVLTGLPRHDALGAGNPRADRCLLIMPTWRQWLVGPTIGKSAVRAENPVFFESEFAQRWREFLHSPRLRALVTAHGYRVQFFPHANLDAYLDWFDAPSYIETLSNGRGASIQEVFRAAALMITDYSSAAFDLAYLRRSVLYYQFDRELVFGGEHTTKKGYYDYDRDGFGPVCSDQEGLMMELECLLNREAKPTPAHLARMENTFAYRDGQSCRRTFDAILALDGLGSQTSSKSGSPDADAG